MRLSFLTTALVCTGLVAARENARIQATSCLQANNVPVVLPQSPEFKELAEPFNLRLQYTPAVIVLPKTEQHVQDAVRCAAQCGLKVQAKSGGHSYASYSTGGRDGSMIINLQHFQDVRVQLDGVAQVGGGVRLGNLAQGIFDQGRRALPHGTCPGVGIGGHATHGGYGHTSRKWGITLDTIVGVDVVLADGSFVHATETEHHDVFWAIRGAAESIGIVTRFWLRTQEAPKDVTYFSFKWKGMQAGPRQRWIDTFRHIEDFARNGSVIDDRISFGIYLDSEAYNLGGTFFGTVEEFQSKQQAELLRGLPEPASITVQSYDWLSYLILMSDKTDIRMPLTGYDEHDTFFTKSITVPERDGLSSESLGAMYDVIQAGSPTPFFVITNLYGGPSSSINAPHKADPSFSAYPHRDTLWVLQLYGYANASMPGSSGNDAIPFISQLTKSITEAAPETLFGAYANYVDPSLSREEAHRVYYGQEMLGRLREIKRDVDSRGVFWNPQTVEV